MVGVRRALILALGLSRVAWAQLCHAPPPEEPKPLGLHARVSAEVATYATPRFEGEYQGVAIEAGWSHRWVQARVVLPGYRVLANGAQYVGVGDVLLDARVPFARTDDDALIAGVELAATLPTGDRSHQLGMGHVMAMPGLWAAWRASGAFAQVQASYGRALVDMGSNEHALHGPSPVVNPMNLSELEVALSGGVSVHARLRLRAGAYGAVPIASPNGAPRASAFLGVDVGALEWLDVGVEGHVPLLGTAFQMKALLFVAARW